HRQETLTQLQQSNRVYALRKELKKGEPRPVCGSIEHPTLAHWQAPSDKSQRIAQEELAAAEQALAEITKQERGSHDEEQKLAEQHRLLTEHLDQKTTVFQSIYGEKTEPVDIVSSKKKLAEQKNLLQEYERLLLSLQKNQVERDKFTTTQQRLAALQQQTTTLQKQLDEQEVIRIEQEKAEQTLVKEWQGLLSGIAASEARKKVAAHEKALRNSLEETKLKSTQIAEQILASKKKLAETQEQLQKSSQQQMTQSTVVLAAITPLGFTKVADAQAALLPPEEATILREKLAQLDKVYHTTITQIKQQEDQITLVKKQLVKQPDESTLIHQIASIETEKASRQRRIGAIQQQISQDATNREKVSGWTQQLPQLEQETRRWARLNDLIGQKDGQKFSRFAQGLTLARLVQLANRQLYLLSRRYRIDRVANADLELEIVDTYQADNRRPTTTLSGGESFLVSLALALGLSDLAGGKTRIQSLFIDEGFGTLDASSLDVVVSALENLQASGKTIGLISHVPALRERIHHQIIVESKGDGFSQLRVA
ncbi:MAG: SbcC/MukB-like Walker B domain-containing protein, partial [Bacteroidota bacterium]